MKYKARLVLYFFDDAGTTSADIYDVIVSAQNISEAIAAALEKVHKSPLMRSGHGNMETDNVVEISDKVSVLPSVKLPVEIGDGAQSNVYCRSRETYYTID